MIQVNAPSPNIGGIRFGDRAKREHIAKIEAATGEKVTNPQFAFYEYHGSDPHKNAAAVRKNALLLARTLQKSPPLQAPQPLYVLGEFETEAAADKALERIQKSPSIDMAGFARLMQNAARETNPRQKVNPLLIWGYSMLAALSTQPDNRAFKSGPNGVVLKMTIPATTPPQQPTEK